MKVNLGFYIQKINDIVKKTEEIGETMNPYFEEVRTAIDQEQLDALTTEKLTDVHARFAEGTESYDAMAKTIKALKPPAKVIGIHKKLEKSYEVYVEACREMVASIDVANKTVDQEKFNSSEEKQDETTDSIAFCIQRMTSLLMK